MRRMTSSIGKFASSSQKKSGKLGSPSFRSQSAQRPKSMNEQVPGPGAHTPNFYSIERNRVNSAPHLKAKGHRMAHSLLAKEASATDESLGPGAYEAKDFTLQRDCERQVQRMSRQNPGFGIAGPAHKLPHEQEVEDDKELPG